MVNAMDDGNLDQDQERRAVAVLNIDPPNNQVAKLKNSKFEIGIRFIFWTWAVIIILATSLVVGPIGCLIGVFAFRPDCDGLHHPMPSYPTFPTIPTCPPLPSIPTCPPFPLIPTCPPFPPIPSCQPCNPSPSIRASTAEIPTTPSTTTTTVAPGKLTTGVTTKASGGNKAAG